MARGRENSEEPQSAGDAFGVEPLERAPGHRWSRAVADGTGNAEAQRRRPSVASRIDGGEEQGAALEEVRRVQLDLRINIRPVRGKAACELVPLLGQWARALNRLGPGRRLLGAEEVEPPANSRCIEPSQHALRVGSTLQGQAEGASGP